ncbi:recombination protein RecR [Candidatus Wolfebacteria bacterium]|nr:MAG: recombination protein RecR [Candidatus Wolfebacteria bacterium]
MDALNKLAEYFSKFPGIGPRQADRFVFSLLRRNANFRKELSDLILHLSDDVSQCTDCFRYFSHGNVPVKVCSTCRLTTRDTESLMIVEKDADFENIEKSGVYHGRYFILGGTIPVLEKDPASRIRINQLMSRIETDNSIKEVILALSVTPQGEQTHTYTSLQIKPICENKGIKITSLGRGVSTGTELEYVDSDTIANALSNRH